MDVLLTKTKIEHGRTGKELLKYQTKNDAKDKLITEFENLITQLTDTIDKDKVLISNQKAMLEQREQ